MKQYRFTIESEHGFHTVNVQDVKSLNDAQKVLRKTFPFDRWRIVNIAETLAS